jgi:hypothetical protein
MFSDLAFYFSRPAMRAFPIESSISIFHICRRRKQDMTEREPEFIATPESITLYTDRRRVLLLLLATLALVIAAAFLVRSNQSSTIIVIGYIAALLFTGISLALVRMFLDRTPRLILDETGLFDRTMKTPKIPWNTILSMELKMIRGSSLICLELPDEDERLQDLPPIQRWTASFNRATGAGLFNVNASALPLSAEEIFTLIVAHVKAQGRKI